MDLRHSAYPRSHRLSPDAVQALAVRLPGPRLHIIAWSFEVLPERQAEFERAYGPDGAWAQLFARSPDYLGTELERDPEQAGRYLTVDRWTTATAFAAFHARWKAEYEALDQACAALTTRETSLGAYDA